MATYTPGPWSADEGGGHIRSLSVPVSESRIGIVQRNVEGNSPLVATAPELLEALKAFVEAFGPVERRPYGHGVEGMYPSPAGNMIKAEVAERAQAIIAKAEGRLRESS